MASFIIEAGCFQASTKPRTSASIVQYEYAHNGTTHVGEREYFGTLLANERCSRKYARGETVTVYHDGDRAVLMPGHYKQALFGLFAGLCFFMFGAIGMQRLVLRP